MKKVCLYFLILLIINLATPSFGQAFSVSVPEPKSQTYQMQKDIREILQDRRFHYPDYFAWYHWIIKKIADLWNWLHPKTKKVSVDPFLKELLKWLGIVLLVLLPFGLIYYIPRLFQRNVMVKRDQAVVTRHPNRTGLQERAALFAASGDFREAIRHLYLANLEHLQNNGYIPGGTRLSDRENIQILRKALGTQDQAYQSFFFLTMLFQAKWYGLKNCSSEDYEQALLALNNVLEKTRKLNGKA